MHTLLTWAAGFLLLGVFLLLGHLWGSGTAALGLAAKVFVPVWLVLAVVNLWVGISHAGYALRDELPVLPVVFLVPAALAAWLAWRWSSAS